MEDVLRLLWQATLVTAGLCWWAHDRLKALEKRRTESWIAWIGRPLKAPPPRTDWEAFEERVAHELAAEHERASAAEDDALAARAARRRPR